MKEKIVLSRLNETEVLRSLASFDEGQFLTRFLNSKDFCLYVLNKLGVSISQRLISRNEETLIINTFINEVDFFNKANYDDSKTLANTLYEVRMSVVDENDIITGLNNNPEFKDKNDAIALIYKKYLTYLKDHNLIDEVGLIRLTINNSTKLDIDTFTLKEDPCYLLEEKLLDSISESKKISLIDLYKVNTKPLGINAYTKGYGKTNEIKAVISDIYTNNYPLDTCEIIISNNTYVLECKDVVDLLSVPSTFGTGLPLNIYKPTTLLKLIYKWDNEGLHGTDSLKEIIYSDSFDLDKLLSLLKLELKDLEDFIKVVGSLKLSFDSASNNHKVNEYLPIMINDKHRSKYTDSLNIFKEELNKGLLYILENYSVISDEHNKLALNRLLTSLNDHYEYKVALSKEVLDSITSGFIKKELSKEGHLHITDIKGGFSTLRKHVYVVGLNASEFPGKIKENYLLLDNDLNKIGKATYTSEEKLRLKKESLINLLNLCSSLDIDLHVSYNGFNLSELKEENPSSVLFDIVSINDYEKFIELFKVAKYFNHNLNNYEQVGKAYNDGKLIDFNSGELDISGKYAKRYSPTQIELFLSCPKRFYLKNVLKLEEPEEDDPYQIVENFVFGNLYHHLMEERKDNRGMSKDEFMSEGSRLFDEYIKSRPVEEKHIENLEYIKNEFVDMVAKGFDSDPNNEVLMAEEYISANLGDVEVYGFPDRIEKDEDGNLIIADFKTKSHIDHKENDVVSCIQAMLYAYIARTKGMDVKRVEYRYPRYEKSISCEYNSENEETLFNLINELSKAIDNSDFKCANLKDRPTVCKYCKFSGVCKKENEEEETYDQQ